jgi:hypothetical protein
MGRNLIAAMMAAYLMPTIVGITLAVTSLVAIGSLRTREWLRFARMLRREHGQLREFLS